MASTPGTRRGARAGFARHRLEIAPALLLVAVATLHAGRALLGSQDPPDKSGGFGLFSTVDRLNNRLLAVTALHPRGPIALDPDLLGPRNERVRRALASPSEAALRTVAAGLRERGLPPALERVPILVEVFAVAFDPRTVRVRLVPLRALTQRAGD